MGRKLLVSLLAAALACAAVAQDTGLLLGLSGKNGESHTVWIGQQGVAVFARNAGDGYWLWKDGGFWHVVNDDRSRTGGRATVTITGPDGETTVMKGEEGRPDTDYFVAYIAPLSIGLLQRMNWANAPIRVGNSGGTVFDGTPTVSARAYRNLAWGDLETAIEVESVFDKQIVKSFYNAPPPAGFTGGQVRDVSASNWTLRRDRGLWNLNGMTLGESRNFLAGSSDYHVVAVDRIDLGAGSMTGPSWARVQSEYLDAIDFTTSPDGSLTVIVTPTDVFVHRSNGSSLGRRVQRVRVQSTRVAMTQWFEGGDVRKVAAEVAKIGR